VAVSLAALGSAATPAIEEALDSIEKEGVQSRLYRATFWLSLAYAKIMGPAAFPRLRRMIENPQLESFHNSLGDSVALSLGLTSYVASSSVLISPSNCYDQEPHHGLDRLILAWERNDQRAVEEGLGPNARAALKSMLSVGGWDALRAELWRGSSRDAAVGYRFEAPGRWSEPEETAGQESPRVGWRDPEIDTVFKTGSGADCGRHTVKFLTQTSPRPAQYLIDNADLRDLLRLVTSCAAETTK